MKLSIYLPASLDEIERFTATCRSLGLLNHYQPVIAGDEMAGYELLGVIDHDDIAPAAPATPPPAEPAPAKPAAKVAKRPGKKAPHAKKTAGPDARTAVLAHLEANNGTFPGGAAALAREVGHGEQATTKVIQRLATEGIVIVDKASKTSTRSITLAKTATVTKLPDYPERIIRDAQDPPQRTGHPALPRTPASLPVGGIKEPAGGWA